MSDERRVPITLRMPRALLDNLKVQADLRSHSMNAEIVHRLLESLSLNDAGYTGSDNLELSGIELGLIGIWRDLSEDERRSVLILLRSIVSNKDAC